jgi:tRNA U38,U39,U40 pseudouridine synthase TruA
VFAFKAQLDDASYQGDPEGLAHAQRISQHLPSSVRVMSAQRVNRKFNARHMCLERIYEYWLPQSLIGTRWLGHGGAAAGCVKMMHVLYSTCVAMTGQA